MPIKASFFAVLKAEFLLGLCVHRSDHVFATLGWPPPKVSAAQRAPGHSLPKECKTVHRIKDDPADSEAALAAWGLWPAGDARAARAKINLVQPPQIAHGKGCVKNFRLVPNEL